MDFEKKFNKVARKMSIFAIILLAVNIFACACWIGNIYKLSQCDFESPWKGEIIHAVGIIPYASVVTVWNSDK